MSVSAALGAAALALVMLATISGLAPPGTATVRSRVTAPSTAAATAISSTTMPNPIAPPRRGGRVGEKEIVPKPLFLKDRFGSVDPRTVEPNSIGNRQTSPFA